MILLLTLDAKLFRSDEFYDAVESTFPDPSRVHFCTDIGGQNGYLLTAQLGLTIGDMEADDHLTETLFWLYRYLGRSSEKDVPIVRTLALLAVEVVDFSQGSKVIAALLAMSPELVLGFTYKSGSIDPVPVEFGVRKSRGELSFKGGFPAESETEA